jgi:hypothetical protein
MKIPTRGALRCANSTLRQVYCFLEISLVFILTIRHNHQSWWLFGLAMAVSINHALS